jgi:transcriptional regulator with XRE-family HTH domain
VQQMKKVPNAIDREIGKRIKAKRLLLGHNQQFLADTIGVSYQQVQKYENGTDRVGASRLFAISKALNVPISYFFETELAAGSAASSDHDLENQVVKRTVATEEGRSLVLSFGRIRDPQLRTKVLELAELLSDAKLPNKSRPPPRTSRVES